MTAASTLAEAEQHAFKIRTHWAKQGYPVSATVHREPYVDSVNTPGYGVRTDLLNGLPRTHPANRKALAKKETVKCLVNPSTTPRTRTTPQTRKAFSAPPK